MIPSLQAHEQRTRRLVSRDPVIATIDHVQQVRAAIAATSVPCPQTGGRSADMQARWDAAFPPAVTR